MSAIAPDATPTQIDAFLAEEDEDAGMAPSPPEPVQFHLRLDGGGPEGRNQGSCAHDREEVNDRGTGSITDTTETTIRGSRATTNSQKVDTGATERRHTKTTGTPAATEKGTQPKAIVVVKRATMPTSTPLPLSR